MNLERLHVLLVGPLLIACGPSPQEVADRIAAEKAQAEAKEAAIMAGPGVVAKAMDSSVDARVGCIDGGDLYFEIGKHLVRVDPSRWALSPYAPADYWSSDKKPLQACKAAPLRIPKLGLAGPMGRKDFDKRVLWLVGTEHRELLRNLRDDFLPRESVCRRGAHWTWCSDERTVELVEQHAESEGKAAVNSRVSLKFDLDYYRTPTGGAFFVADTIWAQWPLRRSVMYQWNDSLTIVSDIVPPACNRPAEFKHADCDPRGFVERDRDARQLVLELLGTTPSSTKSDSSKSVEVSLRVKSAKSP